MQLSDLVKGRHYLVLNKLPGNGERWREMVYLGHETSTSYDWPVEHFKDEKDGLGLYLKADSDTIGPNVKDISINPTSGTKYDGGKTRWSLLPWDIIEGIAKVMTYGAKKYTDNNWMFVEGGEARYFDAMMRHINKINIEKEDIDPDSGFDHIFHALTCLVFYAFFSLKRRKK